MLQNASNDIKSILRGDSVYTVCACEYERLARKVGVTRVIPDLCVRGGGGDGVRYTLYHRARQTT